MSCLTRHLLNFHPSIPTRIVRLRPDISSTASATAVRCGQAASSDLFLLLGAGPRFAGGIVVIRVRGACMCIVPITTRTSAKSASVDQEP